MITLLVVDLRYCTMRHTIKIFVAAQFIIITRNVYLCDYGRLVVYSPIQGSAKKRENEQNPATQGRLALDWEGQITRGYAKYNNIYVKFINRKHCTRWWIYGKTRGANESGLELGDLWVRGMAVTAQRELMALGMPLSGSSCLVVTCGPWPHGCLLLLKSLVCTYGWK